MGSGNSRNAAVSSISKEGNPRQRGGRRHLFQSTCFGPFPELADNSSNSIMQDRKCRRPVGPATRAHGQQETNSGKQSNTENVKASGSRDLYESISSADYNGRRRGRHCKPISSASSSTVRDSIAPELRTSTSIDNEISTRSKFTKYYQNNYCLNIPSNNADHSTFQSRRTPRSGSLEEYSVFARRLRQQRTSVEVNQGFSVGHLQNDTTTQQMQENGFCTASETRSRHHRIHSVQTRQCQSAGLFINATDWRDTFSESSTMAQNDYMSSGQAMSNNSDQNVVMLRRSSSMRLDSRETRRIQGRYGTADHIDRNVSIRRTNSGGHMRDRTLRQESAEGLFTMLDRDSVDREIRRHNGRRLWESLRRSSSHRQVGTQVATGQDQFFRTLRSLSDNRRRSDEIYQINQDAIVDSRNFAEQRSLLLEDRRRRARSQVRALQNLSNNFGNLAGHERSCILGGQHHTARCTCQIVGRTDESNTRTSLSRIMMLAEALFEVLDEIHSQSMALSSRASAVSLGPFPAPDYVVESMPVRIYKEHEIVTNEEPAQCYICLMDYEEGDHMRVLPCHHEFHLICIDKWLKEIHRVCPLCRGNVCDVGLTNLSRDP
ncbi:uncharacterized protein LOC131066679 isoform X1 [Cryptomeria japonica]|uniref:uncharacterized protein LOC131066679 isoform X1 n=1 Tax=Cryptomeria japonica TaxID=3369 RepID=UPI0025AD492B|nr:uncharacterized protein LOC131066679 isoform X1 [Cryptomeria japonica]